jgi:DNA-directed RNA polymerase specialized sigma24 family protein
MLTAGCGYSSDETADIVGMRRGTVPSKANRARNKSCEVTVDLLAR